MKTIYEVWGTRYITSYTTLKKAERLRYEHPMLHLEIRTEPISFIKWLMLKIIFQ